MAAMEPRYDDVVLGWNDEQDETVEVGSIEEAQAGENDVGEVCSQERLATSNADRGGLSRGRSSSLTAEDVSSSKDQVANNKKVADLRTESRKLSTGKTTSDNCKEKGKEPVEADKATSTSGSNPETSQCSKKRKQDLQRRRVKKVRRLLQIENFPASSSRPAAAGAFAREHSPSVEAAIDDLEGAVEVTANLSSSNANEENHRDHVTHCVTCGRTRQYDEKNIESLREAVICSCPEPEAPLTSSVPCEQETTEGETDAALEPDKVGANRLGSNYVERSRGESEQESANTEPEPRSPGGGASSMRVGHDADSCEIESIWASKDGEASYLVKWKGRAHIHNSKLTESEIMKLAPKRMSSFKKAAQQGKEMKWNPLWNTPQRIIGKRARANVVEWLVKWKGLGYDQCTWEADSRGFKDLVVLYEHWCEVQNQNLQNLQNQLVDETSQQEIVRLEKPPEWFRGEPLQPHQLDLLNKLCDCWWTRREGIIVCDLIQEQMVQMAIFIGRLFMEFGVKRPVLVITSREMLQSWETTFEQVSANLNTILYDGPTDVREMVKKYEFNLIEGCPKVQVVLSTISAVNSDVDFLKSIHWSALLVDRSRQAKSHNLSVFSQLETMFRVLVITATQEGTSDLLSFVKCPPPEGSSSCDDLKEKLRAHILWDAGEGSPGLLCEFWVPVQLSPLQVQQYCEVLIHNFELLRSGELCYGEKRLNDLVLELRDCCCHPYLVNSSWMETIKASTVPDQVLDAEVAASGKLHLVRTMLSWCLSKKQTVVLLTQGSHKLMNILDDFLSRQFGGDCYERIQRGMDSSLRQASLQRFNASDSGRFVLLLDRNAMAPRSIKSIDAVIVYESYWNPYKDTAYLQDLVGSSCSKYAKVYRMYSHLTVEESVLVSALEGADVPRSMNAKELQELLRWGVKDLLQMSCWVDSCGDPLKAWDEFLSQGSSQFDKCKQRLIVTSAEEVELMASFSADSANVTGLSEKLRTVLSPRSISANEGAPLFDVTAVDFLDKNLSAKDFWSPLLSERHLQLRSSQKRKSSSLACYDKDDLEKKKRRVRNEKSVGPSEDGKVACEESTTISIEIEGVADLESQALELLLRLNSLCEVLHIPRHVSVRAQQLLVFVATHLNICNSRGDVLGELALALVWVAAEQMNHDLDRPLTIKQASSKLGFELDYIHQIYAKLSSHSLPRPANDRNESLQVLQAGDDAADSDQLDAAAADVPYCEPVPVPDAVPPDRHADKHKEQVTVADKGRETVAAEKRAPENVAERLKMLDMQRLEWAAFHKRKSTRRDSLLKQQARELSVASGDVERAAKRLQHELQLRELAELERTECHNLGARQQMDRNGQSPAEVQDTRTTINGKEQRNPTVTPCAEKQCTVRQPVATAQDNAEEQATTSVAQQREAIGNMHAALRDAQTAALTPQDSQRVAANLEEQGTVHTAVPAQATAVCRTADVATQKQAITHSTDVAPQQQVNPQQHHPVRGQAESRGQGLANIVAAAPSPPVHFTRRLEVLDGLLQQRHIEVPVAVQQPQVEDSGIRGSSVAVPTTSGRQQAEVDTEVYLAQRLEDIFGVQRRVNLQDPLKLEEKKLRQELEINRKTYEEEVAKLRMIHGRRQQELQGKLAKVTTQQLLADALRKKNTIGRVSVSPSAAFLDLQQNVEQPRQVPVVQQQQTTPIQVHSPVLGAPQRRHVAPQQPHQCTTPVSQHGTTALQQQQHPTTQARSTVPQHSRNPVPGVSAGANVSDGVALTASQMLRTQSANRVQSPTLVAHATTAAPQQQQYNNAGTFNLPPPSQMLRTQASAAVAGRVQTPPQDQGRAFTSTVQQVLQGSQVAQQPPLQGLHQAVHGSRALLLQQQQQRHVLQPVVQGFQVVQPPLPQQQREQLVQGLQQVVQGSQSQLQGSQVVASCNLLHPIGTPNFSSFVVLQQQGGVNIQQQQQEQQVMGLGTGVCLVMSDAPPTLNVNHVIELSDDDS